MSIDRPVSREPSKEELAYVEFQEIVNRCLKALEGDSTRWFSRLYRTLLKERERLHSLPVEQQELLYGELDEVIRLMVEWARPEGERKVSSAASPIPSAAAPASSPSFSKIQERIHALEHLLLLPNKETAPLVLQKISPEN